MRTRGRPKKEDIKKNVFIVRLSDEEVKMLEYTSNKTGETKSEVIRKGIFIKHNLAKYS